MPIITDSDQQQESMPEISKEELLALYAQHRRAQAELYRTGNADLLPSSTLEYGQLLTTLRHRYRVCDSELLHALEVHS